MQAGTVSKPIRPLAALKALRALLRNGEDTRQVFLIIDALRGRSGERAFERFRKTEIGRTVLSERRVLLDRLSDRAALARLPEGSLGRAYLAFMAAQNLTAEGLVEASETGDRQALSEERRLFGARSRDTHDLQHVVTGYGRDGLGEVSLLAFGYAKTKNRGIGLIALAGMFKVARHLPGLPVKRAVWEAYRHGRRAAWMLHQDWEALLAEPLEQVRRNLNILPPTRYQSIIAAVAASRAPETAMAAE
ncbi:MAG TPA: Coq4 family protein [Aliidongia sp.]|nr:Coq4 family protein [Aliidongia sp.]